MGLGVTPDNFASYVKSWNNFRTPMENITPNVPASTTKNIGSLDKFNNFMGSDTFKNIGTVAGLGLDIFNAWNSYQTGRKALKEQKAGREALQAQWAVENKRYEDREAERKQANADIAASASVWERK